METLNLRTGEKVLELGCGGGSYAAEAAQFVGPTGHVSAIDISADQITAARERCAGFAWVQCETGNLLELPYSAGKFDVAYSVQVLEYSGDLGKAFHEIHRVLTATLPRREAVERAAEAHLRARCARWVLQQQVVLCRPQLCRVVILHLLLQRAGCRRGQGGARVYDVWRRRCYRDASSHARPRAPELGRRRCGRKPREDQQQSWKQRAFHRSSPFGTSALNQPRLQGCSTSIQVL
jgi:SAM-dependent methyltransferase